MNFNEVKKFGLIAIFLQSVLVCTLTVSCGEDDSTSKMESLQEREWAQLSGIIGDSVYAVMKFFHKVRFNENGSYDMLIDWSGGLPFPDTLILTPLHGDYVYNPDQEKILFPGIIDSGMVSFNGEPELYYSYFTPWKILQVNDTLLLVETDKSFSPPKEPAFIWFGGYKFYFKSVEIN
jgi:hypothetical protein